MLDLAIRNGSIVDGSGLPAWRGDLGIEGGRIVSVGPTLAGAARVIDAAGKIVAPGFIDPHTHFDAQLCWDPQARPSLEHGVTSVVPGNCSLSLAPLRKDQRGLFSRMFRQIEEMPEAAFDDGIDWRWGERWFMRLLIDGDQANNNGNWQWIASVGVDPQPAFRRIYNPARHMERFDPRGSYVRRFVPELRSVPNEHLREPWAMPIEIQRRVGCVIGKDYPGPIVDHLAARQEALARFATG
jgi:hypothetical protein